MAQTILSIVLVALTAAWGIIRWSYNPKRKTEALEKKMRWWENVLKTALAKNDANNITIANLELDFLRSELRRTKQ